MDLSFIIKIIIVLIISLPCSIQDFSSKKVSNWIIFLGCFIMMIYCFAFEKKTLFTTLLSPSLLLLVFLTGKLLLKEKLGWGDVYFSIFIGLTLPFPWAPLSVIISVITALLYFLLIAIKNRSKTLIEGSTGPKKPQTTIIPFIPFLSLGLIITLVLELFFT